MRKINIKQLLFSLVMGVVIATTSCSKWLDVSPKADMKAEDIYSTEAGFRDGLIGVYAMMSKDKGYGQRLTYGYVDVLAQYYSSPSTNTGYVEHTFAKAARYNYTDKVEEERVDSIWRYSYKAVANINLALQFIDKNKGVFSTENIYNIYKGEYLALRALLHFDILRLFASSPKMDGGNGGNSLAIPYIDSYTNIAQPQLTVKETLKKIEGDLLEAKMMMKGRDVFNRTEEEESTASEPMKRRIERLNYWAVTALLSRVYLYADMKSEALTQAKELIGEVNGTAPAPFELTSTGVTQVEPMFKKEIIFRLDVQKLKNYTEGYFIKAASYIPTLLTISDAGRTNMFDEKNSDNDFRKGWLIVSSSGNNTFMISKYNDIKYVPMFKISELYLIAAETAPGQEGLDYLNKLREHRGLGKITDLGELSTNIYKEYRREFIGEGQLFFFYKRNVYRVVGAADNIAIQSPEKAYNLPIPLDELDFGNIKR